MTLAQALAQKIREFLAREAWSQRDFARQFGVSQASVSALLSTKRRGGALDYYERLAGDIFGVPLSDLITDLEALRYVSTRTRVRADSTEGDFADADSLLRSPLDRRASDRRALEEDLRRLSRATVEALWARYHELYHVALGGEEERDGTAGDRAAAAGAGRDLEPHHQQASGGDAAGRRKRRRAPAQHRKVS